MARLAASTGPSYHATMTPSDHLDDAAEPDDVAGDHNQPPILGVAELSAQLKRTVEESFGLVRVRGEISRPTMAASGHCYLRLKDENAVLDAIIWRGTMQRLPINPEEGMDVVCTGRLTTYAGRSTYQIIIERMDVAGEGALLKMIEERRRRLAAEGLFDDERKLALPYLPETIGVVTSPTGAVIRDILHRLDDRFPRHVLLWPVSVQGEKAAGEVAAAIEGFNRLSPDGPVPRPDLLIVARGGGSLEDLMAFNEEAVVRAAAASEIPLISAVGHETDTTLIDYAADIRAPTPTAAAEMAVPVRTDLMAQIAEDGARTIAAMARRLAEHEQRIIGLSRGLPDPHRALETAMQRFDDWGERLLPAFARYCSDQQSRVGELALRLPTPQTQVEKAKLSLANFAERLIPAMRQHLTLRTQALALETQGLGAGGAQIAVRLATGNERAQAVASRTTAAARAALERADGAFRAAADLLESFSYQRVLERGFAMITARDGQPVTTVAGAPAGAHLTMVFHDGTADAVVTGKESDAGKPKSGKAKTPKSAKPTDGQGSLL